MRAWLCRIFSKFLWLPSHRHILTSINQLALPIFSAFGPGHDALGDPQEAYYKLQRLRHFDYWGL